MRIEEALGIRSEKELSAAGESQVSLLLTVYHWCKTLTLSLFRPCDAI